MGKGKMEYTGKGKDIGKGKELLENDKLNKNYAVSYLKLYQII